MLADLQDLSVSLNYDLFAEWCSLTQHWHSPSLGDQESTVRCSKLGARLQMDFGLQDEANEMLSGEEEGDQEDMDANTWHSTGTSKPFVV